MQTLAKILFWKANTSNLTKVQKNNQTSTKRMFIVLYFLFKHKPTFFIEITVCMCFIQIKLSFHLQISIVHPTHPILEIPQVKENMLSKGTSQPYYLIFLKSTFCTDHMFCYNTLRSSQESQSISPMLAQCLARQVYS